MHQLNYQTVRLTRGKHASPHHGVCAMELASMLAGEPFTDQPSSASRTIGAFLRIYNDVLDNQRRQDLYSYASQVVGTADGKRVERDRAERLARWAEEMWQRRTRRMPLRRLIRRPMRNNRKDPESSARCAIRAMGKVNDKIHACALALVDELVDLGALAESGPAATDVAAPNARQSGPGLLPTPSGDGRS